MKRVKKIYEKQPDGTYKRFECLKCGRRKPHYAKGLCMSCYELCRRGYKRDFYRMHYAKSIFNENHPIKELQKECCG